MSVQKVNAYLFFNGDAREAIAHYEKILGAKVLGTPMRYSEAPGGQVAAAVADRIMHATLQIGETVVMASDTTPERAVQPGGSVHLVVTFGDEADMAGRFDALAAGGRVEMALHDAFWGDRFGALVDRFGVHWMFICEKKR